MGTKRWKEPSPIPCLGTTCLFLASWKQTRRYVAVGSLFETLGEADYSDAKHCDTNWYCNTTPQVKMQIPPSGSAQSTNERARLQEDYLLQTRAVSGILNMCAPDRLAVDQISGVLITPFRSNNLLE